MLYSLMIRVFRGCPAQRRRVPLIGAATFLFLAFVSACGSSNSSTTPVPGGPATCVEQPPAADQRAPIANCGVSGIEIFRPGLPIAPSVGTIIVDLYIAGNGNQPWKVCALGIVFCGVEDGRPQPSQGGKVVADDTRNRVRATFDFVSGVAKFRINPSCNLVHDSNVAGYKNCNPPHPDGAGNNVSNAQTDNDGTVSFDTSFSQTNFPIKLGACAIHNVFSFSVNGQTGAFHFTGNGASFPSLVLSHSGQAVYSFDQTNLTSLCLHESPVDPLAPNTVSRSYDYFYGGSQAPPSTSTTSRTVPPPPQGPTIPTTKAPPPPSIIGGNLSCDSASLMAAFNDLYDPELTTGSPVCLVVGNVKYAEQMFCGTPPDCTPRPNVFVPNADGGVVWVPVGIDMTAVCPPNGALSKAVAEAFLLAGVHICGV